MQTSFLNHIIAQIPLISVGAQGLILTWLRAGSVTNTLLSFSLSSCVLDSFGAVQLKAVSGWPQQQQKKPCQHHSWVIPSSMETSSTPSRASPSPSKSVNLSTDPWPSPQWYCPSYQHIN